MNRTRMTDLAGRPLAITTPPAAAAEEQPGEPAADPVVVQQPTHGQALATTAKAQLDQAGTMANDIAAQSLVLGSMPLPIAVQLANTRAQIGVGMAVLALVERVGDGLALWTSQLLEVAGPEAQADHEHVPVVQPYIDGTRAKTRKVCEVCGVVLEP